MKGEFERLNAGPTLWEEHHVLVFTNAQGKFVGSILIPRDPRLRNRVGFLAMGDGIERDIQPMTNLPSVIAHLEALAH